MPDSIKDITEYEAYLIIWNILSDKEKVNQTRINNKHQKLFLCLYKQ